MSRLDPRRLLGNKFVKDTATLQVATLLNQIGQVACSVLIAFLLGAHEQGLYALALSLQAFLFNLLNVGVLQATIVQVAAAAVRDQRSKLTQWIAFLVKAYLVINVAVICVAYFALPPLAERIYGERLGHEAARQLGLWGFWLCFFPLIDTARVAIFAALQGTRRMLPIARLDNMMEIVRVFLVISGALITNSPRGAVLGEIAARVVAIPIALSLYRGARHDGLGYLPGVREILAELRGIPLRRGIRLGLRVGMLKNTHTIFLSVLPSLFLGALAGASWVAWFNVARRFMDLPSLLMQAVTRTALPALSEIAGLRDGQRFRRLFLRITGLGAALITAGTLLFLPFVKPLTQWLYPPDYVDPRVRLRGDPGHRQRPGGRARRQRGLLHRDEPDEEEPDPDGHRGGRHGAGQHPAHDRLPAEGRGLGTGRVR